ncbi:MAG: hypothetical protein V4739_08490 [Pseudomonadota bacterium]
MSTILNATPLWLHVTVAVVVVVQLIWRSIKGPERFFARVALAWFFNGVLIGQFAWTQDDVISDISAVLVLVAVMSVVAMNITEFTGMWCRR